MKINYRNLQKMLGFPFFMISLGSIAQSQPLSKGSTAPTFSTEASRAGKEFHFSMKNAIAKDSSLAKKAASDLEFAKYFTNADFMGILH